MTNCFKAAVFLLMFELSPAALPAASSNGWFQDDCGGTTFHITENDGPYAGQEIVFRLNRGSPGPPLGAYLTGTDWFEVEGKRCSKPDKCVQATKAKLWLDDGKGKIKHVSGKYLIDLGGQHFEGWCLVVNRKHKGVFLCE